MLSDVVEIKQCSSMFTNQLHRREGSRGEGARGSEEAHTKNNFQRSRFRK